MSHACAGKTTCPRHTAWPAGSGGCAPISDPELKQLGERAHDAIACPHDMAAPVLARWVLALIQQLDDVHASLGSMTAHRDALLRAREHDQDELRTLRKAVHHG